MTRLTAPAARLLPVLGAAVLIASCGSPPQPLPTAPPEEYAPPSGAAVPASAAAPSIGLPTGLPTAPGWPTYAAPTLPTYAPPRATAPPSTAPPPAPKCTHGPTAAQVIAAARAAGDIPAQRRPEVKRGPFCARSWQFTVIGEAGKTLDQVEPLYVVTTGTPSTLRVEEAGADVCSDRVQNDAPPGIRVLACGS